MVTAKSMEIRDDFKKWCNKAADGEVVQILRPGKNSLYIISQETYEKFDKAKRMAAYTSYLYGKDKITNLKRLSEIQSLKENWNNNGASAFSETLVNSVRKIMLSVDKQPEIFPTACDSIQLEWDKDNGDYLEMEVADDSIAVFFIDSSGKERHWNIGGDMKEINDILGGFYGGIL